MKYSQLKKLTKKGKPYKLELPTYEHLLHAVHGLGALLALWDVQRWLRNEIKYNHKEYGPVLELLYEAMERKGIDLDHLLI